MAPSLPGQSGSWWGQAIQVALCGSHSAGIRNLGANVPVENGAVGVDAAVAEERPVAPDGFDKSRVALRDHDLFFLSGFRDVSPEGIRDERMAEERDAVGAWLVFMPDAVRRRNVHTVRDGVTALDGAPRFDLRCTPFIFLCRMPPDRRRIEEHLRTEQR